MTSARVGDDTPLHYPDPAPLPLVVTATAAAESATIDDLEWLGMVLGDQLDGDGRSVDITVERSVGSVHVGNSRGVEARYDVATVTMEIVVTGTTSSATRPTTVRAWGGWSGLPTEDELDALASDVDRRLRWADRESEAPRGAVTVCFTPRGVAPLLIPLRQALRGKSMLYRRSPWTEAMDTRVCDEGLTLVDDPLQDGRMGSRPIDDEGVVCRRLPLIERGVVTSGIYDLETAELADVPLTGHGRRTTFGKPQAAYSNLLLDPGEHDSSALLALVGDGLVIDGLSDGGGFAPSGTFRAPVELAYRVINGEIVGHIGDARASGNVFRLLERVRGLGSDAQWVGSMSLPAMVVEGVVIEP